MSTTTWPSWPVVQEDELARVIAVLKSGRTNYWTGTECTLFERDFAAWSGASHAVALSNGTVALELALRALGIGPGDEVIVTARSFIASASCVVTIGATPVFADVDNCSQNITSKTVAAVLSPRTKAIIAVHLAGWPCDMPSIMALAQQHGIKVIEDCAQAHGARVNDKSVGSFGDAAAWSFCQDKIMTTGGEGGMLTTNDEVVWERAWSYKDHGKSYAATHAQATTSGFRWVHDSIGTNWRMLEMQAAIGRLQLDKLKEWHSKRTENANVWRTRLLRWRCLRAPVPPESFRHAWYKFYVFVENKALRTGWSRDRLLTEISAASVPCFTGSCPEIYRERAFAGRSQPQLDTAHQLGETSLMFLVHPTLTPEHIHTMADIVDTVLEDATA